VGKENPSRRSHLRKRLEAKVIFQDKRIGKVARKDCGSKKGEITFSLIVVRVEIILRSVGHFIHSFV
jgi:hypothetical protein